MLSRFHLIPERYGRKDGQTDGQICYIVGWPKPSKHCPVLYINTTLCSIKTTPYYILLGVREPKTT